MIAVQMGIAGLHTAVTVEDGLQVTAFCSGPGRLQFLHFPAQGQDVRTGTLHEFADRFCPEIFKSLLHIADPQFSRELDGALICKGRVHKAAQERRLAAAVDTDEPHFFALADRKAYMAEHIVAAKALGQAIHGNKDIHHSSYP